MGDRYVLGFAPTLRFIRSQILYRLYESPSNETGNRTSVCLSACKNITYARQRSCSPRQSSMDYGHTKITQHALKVSRVFRMLKLFTTLKKNMGTGTLAFGSNVHQRSCSPRQLGGLWKHPHINPACSNSVKSLQKVEVGHYTEAEEHGQRDSGVWPERTTLAKKASGSTEDILQTQTNRFINTFNQVRRPRTV